MIPVSRRARSRPDRGGDPLDGLVNLFDLGVVLALAFLLAALSSLKLTDVLTEGAVTVKEGQQTRTVQIEGERVVGQGKKIGSVYQLDDGRTVVVEEP